VKLVDRLYDLAEVLRSKNAGPLYTTLDVLFADRDTYQRVMSSEVLTPDLVADLYGPDSSEVRIVFFDAAKAVKVTFPRVGPTSGAPGDRDVYGAQQHVPLANVMIP
jgi:hypothetical protein